MKKLFVILAALALIAVMVLPAGVVAAASPQEDVSGFVVLAGAPPFVELKTVGAEHLMKGWTYHAATYTGSISGSGSEAGIFTYNLKSLALASTGVETFSGTVLGKTGTLTFHYFHGGLVQMGMAGEPLRIEQTIISGTGELAKLRGTLHFTVYSTASGTYEGTYSGKLHFVP